MLRIRLSRHGRKKKPHYRVVVAERHRAKEGRFVEIVGYYTPTPKPIQLKLDLDRIDYWVKHGAQPSDTVRVLIKKVRQAL